ncbi:hypothetical protein [Belnapia sp. F-4-1]|uniref:hypothetical protein n=1 Tax=Belnapia sp. F-4-1 TaxID=1545443 RepID=UPI0005BA8D31|nr:hypothetical protein [Belnapia sp. F-4-1]
MANGAITRDAGLGTTLAEARDVFVKRHEAAEHPAMPAAALALGEGAPAPRNPWSGVVATRLCRVALALPKAA